MDQRKHFSEAYLSLRMVIYQHTTTHKTENETHKTQSRNIQSLKLANTGAEAPAARLGNGHEPSKKRVQTVKGVKVASDYMLRECRPSEYSSHVIL